jgi:hypothetical protein
VVNQIEASEFLSNTLNYVQVNKLFKKDNLMKCPSSYQDLEITMDLVPPMRNIFAYHNNFTFEYFCLVGSLILWGN